MILISALLALLTGTTPQLPLSIAATDDALAVFANPAGLARAQKFSFYYLYNFRRSEFIANNSFCVGTGSLGAYWQPRPQRWAVAVGTGSDELSVGLRLSRDSAPSWDVGTLWRPTRWLSAAAMVNDIGHASRTFLAGAAFRPVGNRLTISVESRINTARTPVLGFVAEPLDGIRIGARVKPQSPPDFTLGLTFGFGGFGVGFVHSQKPSEIGGFVRLGQERMRSLLRSPACYLDMRLAQPVQDQKPGFSLMGLGQVRTTWQLLNTIRRAERDPSVKGLLLRLDRCSMSWAQLQELRTALNSFRATGKKVLVHAHSLSMSSYYLASAADRIAVHPLSDVILPGFAARAAFLKGTLDKLGIKAQPVRHGKYKSAVETFTEDSLTASNREQLEAIVNSLYGEWTGTVAQARNLPPDSLEVIIQRAFFSAADARAVGLVDTICYDDELDSIVSTEFSRLKRLPENRFRPRDRYAFDWRRPDATVAVIYASGSIRTGESGTDFLTGERSLGAATLVRAIREVRNDKNVKAVILRIDSPGGDGFASDLIWRELELCRRKKPVIVSMSSMAASGGYYIACGADRIYALPGTITGSIGVFSLDFVTEGLYNRLGIRRQSVKRGEHADMGETRERTPEEDSIAQNIIDRFYEQFVSKVAAGRRLSAEQVDSVAQGRVWSGQDALAVGLVDSLGGFLHAYDYALHCAGLRECEPMFYPRARRSIGHALRERLTEVLIQLQQW
ncbi:MAG: signal peptide peptidase SppA [candidate division WOR-3 bacterium]